jgi:Txe/YoeB family toxin of toxin-antitoxin system
MYQILFTKQACKDIKRLNPKQKDKLKRILKDVIAENPFIGKKLVGSLQGNYSYRLDIKNRLVYGIDTSKRIVYVKRARTHYSD